MVITTEILTADEAWVALALLHRRHTDREAFSAKEIMESAKLEKANPELRAGLQPHIYLHNVANIAPNSAKYRMFYKLEGGKYRLYRPGDDYHPDRKGKITPSREDLPVQYHHLLDWYEKDYSRRASSSTDNEDPVLQMWGVGKELWAEEGGDAFIARERAGWDSESEDEGRVFSKTDTVLERTWRRIVAHQGAEFRTVTGHPFTHNVEDESVIRFYLNGKRRNHHLTRDQVDQAISMCPVSKPSAFKKLPNHPYLFGLIMDPRIRSTDW
jgi:hypothetical protein